MTQRSCLQLNSEFESKYRPAEVEIRPALNKNRLSSVKGSDLFEKVFRCLSHGSDGCMDCLRVCHVWFECGLEIENRWTTKLFDHILNNFPMYRYYIISRQILYKLSSQFAAQSEIERVHSCFSLEIKYSLFKIKIYEMQYNTILYQCHSHSDACVIAYEGPFFIRFSARSFENLNFQ